MGRWKLAGQVWGGRGGVVAPSSLFQVHTHKGKQDGGQLGHFHKLWYFSYIIFTHYLGPDAYSAVRGQQFRAKNIKVAKIFWKHFLELQTFCTVQGHSAVLFSTNSEQNYKIKQLNIGSMISTRSLHNAHTIFPQLNTNVYLHTFPLYVMGGLMRINLQYLLGSR